MHKVLVEAAKKLGKLFPNREIITIDLAEEPEPERVPEEDETAASAGTQPRPSLVTEPPPGEEEEWVDWVDWRRVWPREA